MLLPYFSLFAQEEDIEQDEIQDEPHIESDWIHFDTDLYTRGDKNFVITLGVILPAFFAGNIDDQGHGLSVGGTGSLAFNYFLGPNLFIGGEFSGMFAGTRGENMLFMIPFGLRIGYQFLWRRFEFPISLMIGGVPTRKLEEGYFGFIMKPGASAFWRFNPDWSFGLNTVWWFVPQWPKDGKNAYGNFIELTVSARYHF